MRLRDNHALTAALQHSNQVIPLFIIDPALLNSPYSSEKRLAFLLAGLRALDEALNARGSRLIVRRGRPQTALNQLISETGANAVFAEADYSNYARRRDGQIAQSMPLHLIGSPAIHPPGSVLKKDGEPYTVFTPFSRTWLSLPLPREADLHPIPRHFSDPGKVCGEPLPDQPQWPADSLFPAGETEGRRRLLAFAGDDDSPLFNYDQQRDRMDLDGTSRLSPYLRLGMISAREAAVTALSARTQTKSKGQRHTIHAWLNELIWRDFYIHMLDHFPEVGRKSFRPETRNIEWRNDEDEFEAWCAGQTGYPVVDAAMRQLVQSGWVHNRARMIVASFLVKDLLIDWRWGERWFMQHLLDGDPAANNCGWQWSAGTGTDAAPYFRIFNPTTQAKKFDPQGDYIRRWVPELQGVDNKHIHEPWRMSAEAQRAANFHIGRDYPAPIIDHTFARQRALSAYANAKAHYNSQSTIDD